MPNEFDAEEIPDVAALVQRVAEAISEKRVTEDADGHQARKFAAGMLDKLADAKLPEIIGLPLVQKWMTQHGITKQKLANALTERRRELGEITKAKADKEAMRVEKRRQRMATRHDGSAEPVLTTDTRLDTQLLQGAAISVPSVVPDTDLF
jgi:hypothetical protein